MKERQEVIPFGFLLRNLLVLTSVVLLGAGCAAAPPQGSQILRPEDATPSPALAELNNTLAATAQQVPASTTDYRLGPEDLLEITLFSVPEAEAGVTPRRMEARVSEQGVITLPLLGDIPATGVTTAALEQTLQERYAPYLRRPEVGVVVKEYHSQRISVIGAVQNPGVFALSGPQTLIDLLAQAGGVRQDAGSQVHIYRREPAGRQSYVIDLYALSSNGESANLPVQAGDVINVPKAGMFFVDGAVQKPGAQDLDRPFTLSQAIASAGGVDRELASTSDVTILRRRGPGEVETLLANLDEIRAGKGVDPQIEAEDVIIVPTSTAKFLVKRFISGSLISGFSLSHFLYR